MSRTVQKWGTRFRPLIRISHVKTPDMRGPKRVHFGPISGIATRGVNEDLGFIRGPHSGIRALGLLWTPLIVSPRARGSVLDKFGQIV